MNNSTRAIFLALAGFFVWVIGDAFVKVCSTGNNAVPPFVILAAFGLFGAFSLGVSTAISRGISPLRPKSKREIALMCLCSLGIGYANIVALKHLPLTTFYVAVFTAPLVIAIFSSALKHERPTPLKIGCLIAGFLGTALALGVRETGGDWIGYTAALSSVACFSASTVLMRKTAATDTAESIQFFRALFMGLVGLAGTLIQTPELPKTAMLAFLLAAAAANIAGNVLYNKAVQRTSATTVEQYHYTQIVFGAVFGYFFWHEIPTWNLIAGSAIIVGSGIIVGARARQEAKTTLLPPSTTEPIRPDATRNV